MIQTEFHVDQLFESLALGRYFIHKEEIRRSLEPILREVYNIGYDCGVADNVNNLCVNPESTQINPFQTLEAKIEVVTHNVEEESNNDISEVPTTEPVSNGVSQDENTVL